MAGMPVSVQRFVDAIRARLRTREEREAWRRLGFASTEAVRRLCDQVDALEAELEQAQEAFRSATLAGQELLTKADALEQRIAELEGELRGWVDDVEDHRG